MPPPPEAAAAAPPAAAGDERQRLDDVIVTAQKTKQSARKVPLSVTAIDGETVKLSGAAGLADVGLYVPNARFEAHSPGSPQVFIRGFGTNAFNPSFESSVAFVQDELYFGRPGYITQSMFDIDRIEVLRGPQGTLFGKNTVAGVFNVSTREPEEGLQADGSVFYGEQNERRVEAGIGGMFADWGGARLAVYSLDRDGQLNNDYLNRKEDSDRQRGARLKLRLLPVSNIDSTLTLSSSRTSVPFWPYQLYNLSDSTRTYLQSFDSKIEDNPYDFNASFNTPGKMDTGADTAGLKTTWTIGDFAGLHDFTSVLVLGASRFHIDQHNELDDSPADLAQLDSHERHRQASAELRFTGRADSLFGLGTGLEFVAGLFHYHSDFDLTTSINAGKDVPSYLLTSDACTMLGIPAPVCSLEGALGLPGLTGLSAVSPLLLANDHYSIDYGQRVDSDAVFGQFTWNLTERFAITPGVRVSRESKDVGAAGTNHCLLTDQGITRPCITQELLGSKTYDEQGLSRSETDVSPKLALQYFSDADINYYASYTRGYKSGGFNALSFKGGDLEYRPEKAQTYELGYKAKFLERTLGVNLTLFQTHFDDLQVLAYNGVNFDVSNAAAARSRGVEADFLWLTPYAPLRLAGTAGLLDAKYLDYNNAPAPIAQGTKAKQSLAGRTIAFAPKETATFTPTLTYPVGELLLSFAGDVIFQGEQYTDTDLDEATHVGGYTKYGARVALGSADGLWSLTLAGTNLSNKLVLDQVIDTAFFPGAYYAHQAAGRQLFALVGFKL